MTGLEPGAGTKGGGDQLEFYVATGLNGAQGFFRLTHDFGADAVTGE